MPWSNPLEAIARFIGDAINRWIRTVAPLVVAYFVSKWPWVEGLFGDLDDTTIYAFTFAAWYSAVAFLESRVHSAFGWLLGSPKQTG